MKTVSLWKDVAMTVKGLISALAGLPDDTAVVMSLGSAEADVYSVLCSGKVLLWDENDENGEYRYPVLMVSPPA